MFARVAIFEGPPERLADLTRTFEERVKPALRQLSAYHAVYWLVDQDSGRAISVSLWESAEAASPTEAQGAQLRALSAHLGFTVQSVERYEVAAQDHPTNTLGWCGGCVALRTGTVALCHRLTSPPADRARR